MRLIGLSGLMHSGKDTTCQYIKDSLPDQTVTRAAFADKLKTMAAMAIGFEEGDLIAQMNDCKEDWVFEISRESDTDKGIYRSEVTTFTGRQYLQWLGGNARKVFGDTFWIDQVLPVPQRQVYGPSGESRKEKGTVDLERMYPDTDILVVSDVRYENEAERIWQLGGEVWKIIRPGLKSDGHSSEIPLPDSLVDWTIVNDGTLDDLARKVKESL